MSLALELNLDVPFRDPAHEALLSIVRTAGLLATLGDALFREFGLTEAQFNLLFVLKYKIGDLTQSDLGKRLVVSRASITSVLDRLEKKAFVVRKQVAGNRRIHHVELTPAGSRLIDAVEPRYRDLVHRVMGDLSADERRDLIAALERVRQSTRGFLSESDGAPSYNPAPAAPGAADRKEP